RVLESRPLGGEQSNSSHLVNDEWVLKLLRRVEPGVHPEEEMLEYLNTAGFPHVPRLAGTLQYQGQQSREPATVATLVGFTRSDEDAYVVAVDQAAQFIEWALAVPGSIDLASVAPPLMTEATASDVVAEGLGRALSFADLLGRRTAELHLALAGATERRM